MSPKLDLRKLEEFDKMAVDGADGATKRLSGLTGVEADVECSRLHVVSTEEVLGEFERDDALAISIHLEGYLEGEVVTVFDRQSGRELAEAFMPMLPSDSGYTDKHEGAAEEICNVMVSGYVDGWADMKEDSIVMSPPVVVSSAMPDSEEEGNVETEYIHDGADAIAQRSTIVTPDGEIEFEMYMFLEDESTERLFGAESGSVTLDDETLGTFNAVIDEEVTSLTEQLGERVDLEIDVEHTVLDIVPTERLSGTVSDESSAGVVVELTEVPRGYLLVLFDEVSGDLVGRQVDPEEGLSLDAERLPEDDRERAIATAGSGIIESIVDGLTAQFGDPIETTPPTFVDDMRSSLVNDAAVNLGPDERFVLNFEVALEALDEEFTCTVYTLIRPNDVLGGWD